MDTPRADIRDAELYARMAEAERRLSMEIARREQLERQLTFATQRLKDILGATN
jgi:hypothetical protein